MRAVDIMTHEVITVGEKATIPKVAELLAKNGISAVPVVDKAGRVIGMVSEGDLLHRAETGTERRRSWWLEMLASTNQLARRLCQIACADREGGMTRDVIRSPKRLPSPILLCLLETNGIKRVPVMRDGKLVGIVSRANLVQAFAMTLTEPAADAANNDLAIREKLLGELKAQRWAEVSPINVTVKDRVVHLWNSYASDDEKQALLIAARNIPGVRRGRGPYARGWLTGLAEAVLAFSSP